MSPQVTARGLHLPIETFRSRVKGKFVAVKHKIARMSNIINGRARFTRASSRWRWPSDELDARRTASRRTGLVVFSTTWKESCEHIVSKTTRLLKGLHH